jgi:hypothetical protein
VVVRHRARRLQSEKRMQRDSITEKAVVIYASGRPPEKIRRHPICTMEAVSGFFAEKRQQRDDTVLTFA